VPFRGGKALSFAPNMERIDGEMSEKEGKTFFSFYKKKGIRLTAKGN
jgi:hypothetical protein